jgi:flagellar biosynthesis/type III secretory pathway protein FliH
VVEGGSEIYAPRYCFRLIATQSYAPADLRGPNLVALLIRLERSRTRSSLRQVIRDLAAALPRPDEGGLRRAFLVWLRRVLLPGKGKEDIPELVDLEDFRAMLSETVEKWNQELMRKGEKRGERKGLAEGLVKGLEKGRQESRDLLLRQLTVKFGPLDDRTRARVEAAGPQRLMKMAERLLTAERLADVFGR